MRCNVGKRVVDEIFDPLSHENPELFNGLWQHFSKPEHWGIYEDMNTLLHKLLNRDIYVGLASNFDKRLQGICMEHFPLIESKHIFYSSKLGYAKPHIQFYKQIERYFNDLNYSFIMIGDDLENDIIAAKKAGWNAIHRNDISSLLLKLDLEEI